MKISHFLFKNKTKLFIVSFVIALISIPFIFGIKPDFSYKAWFNQSDKYLIDYQVFEQEFGNEDFLSIAIYNPNGVINQPNIDLIKKASSKLAETHRVRNIDSLTNFKKIYGDNEDIYVKEVVDSTSKQYNLSEIKQKINSTPIIQNYLINKKQTLSVIYLRMLPVFNKKHEYDQTYNQAKAIMEKIALPIGTEFHLSGSVAVIQGLSKEVKKDVSFISPLLLVLILLMTFFIFRSKLVTIIPLITISATLTLAFSLGALLGVSFNPITSMTPHILMAICVADCIHIISAYFSFYAEDPDKEMAIKKAINKKFAPTLYTSLTTSIGFLSLTLTDIKPIYELGIIAGVGTMFAWALTFTMVPFILSKSNFEPKNKRSLNRKNLFTANYINLLNNYAYHIIFLAIACSAVGFTLSKDINVNSSTANMLSEKHPVRIGKNLIKKEFGGAGSIDVLVLADGNELIELLHQTQTFQTWLDSQSWATKTISIVDYVKELNKVFESGKDKDYKIANTSEKNASLLFLHEIASGNEQESKWITNDKDKTRINILWKNQGSHEANQIIQTIEEKAQEMGISVLVSGKTNLLKGINTYLVEVFVRSIIVAIVLVFFFMYFNLRSFYLTLISMIPNIIPIFFGLGAMYVFKIDIDFAAVMVASVCLGIVIDDTIHFFHGFRHAPQENVEDKLLYVLNSTGHALINTSIVLIVSFLTFLFGEVSLNFNFGILTIVIIFVALICDLVILPSILLKSKRLIPSNNKAKKKLDLDLT